MKQTEKQNLIDAVNFIYSVSAKAPVEKAVHDNALSAAKLLVEELQKIEVEVELEKVD
jgi:hypothetical protein